MTSQCVLWRHRWGCVSVTLRVSPGGDYAADMKVIPTIDSEIQESPPLRPQIAPHSVVLKRPDYDVTLDEDPYNWQWNPGASAFMSTDRSSLSSPYASWLWRNSWRRSLQLTVKSRSFYLYVRGILAGRGESVTTQPNLKNTENMLHNFQIKNNF